jgi:5-formyltetrahydrofolate cyclo-ligase
MMAEAETAFEKSTLRAQMLQQLQTMTSDDRIARSEKICARVFDSPAWQTARAVLLFSSMRTEPQIAALETAAVTEGKSIFIIPQTLRVESELELTFTPDLVLVPGLAFSRAGHRLGRGGGFYDRLLRGRAAHAIKVGVCFAFQLVEAVPIEPHDAIMNAVMSD